MVSKKVPHWVEASVSDFTGTAPDRDAWTKESSKEWSKVVVIHYPPLASVSYVVDALNMEGTDWIQLPGNHLIEEFANNAARKRAYNDGVPHRVRMVVWDG